MCRDAPTRASSSTPHGSCGTTVRGRDPTRETMTTTRRHALALTLAISLASLAPACAEREIRRDDRPNLILISLDTTRADRLGSYGNERDTTPHLDAFAASANRYENAYAPGPWTYTSHVEMLTGQVPHEIGIHTTAEIPVPESIPILSEPLAAAGYQAAAFVDSSRGGFVGADKGFGRGFEDYHHRPHDDDLQIEFDADATVRSGIGWLEDDWDERRPFLLFLHTKTPHTIKVKEAHEAHRTPPYDVNPAEKRFRYLSEAQAADPWQDPELGKGSEILDNLTDRYVRGELDPADFPAERIETLMALYDTAIRVVDDAFGELVSYLRANDLYDGAMIVVTADHGEEFLEHGTFKHHQLYRETTRVPLIVKFPGQTEGRVIDANVRLADIAPTLLAAAGIAPGRDQRGVVLTEASDRLDPERPIFGARYRDNPSRRQMRDRRQHLSLRQGSWSLVYRLYIPTKEERFELYDLAVDPEERHPVTDQPERLAEMERALREWHASWPPLRNRSGELDDETREDLRELGYIVE